MKKKKSCRVLWNVFLFVICGGSLIYGFVQHQRVTEGRVATERCEQQIDSMSVELESTKGELEKLNEQLVITLKQLQVEKNAALSAHKSNQ
jgi:hypothetical protein